MRSNNPVEDGAVFVPLVHFVPSTHELAQLVRSRRSNAAVPSQREPSRAACEVTQLTAILHPLPHTTSYPSVAKEILVTGRIPLLALVGTLTFAMTLHAQLRPVSDTITTSSGLRYTFLKRGAGATPKSGDLIVMHSSGRLADGKEFWNTRSVDEPFEYLAGSAGVIKGFAEGMKLVRAGDIIEMTMKPELAYGAAGAGADIPPNATLTFVCEILAVHPLSIAGLMEKGLGNIDSTLAAMRGLPNLKDYYVSEMYLGWHAQRVEGARNREKVLEFAVSLLPQSYNLHWALGRALERRTAVSEAMAHYEAALRLNPRNSETQRKDADSVTAWIAKLRAEKPETIRRAQIRAELERLYAQSSAAMMRNDIVAVMELWSDSFHSVRADGTRQERAAVQQTLQNQVTDTHKWNQLTIMIDSLTVTGDTATVVVWQFADRMMRRADNNVHQVQTWGTRREIWLYERNRWLLWRWEAERNARTLIDQQAN